MRQVILRAAASDVGHRHVAQVPAAASDRQTAWLAFGPEIWEPNETTITFRTRRAAPEPYFGRIWPTAVSAYTASKDCIRTSGNDPSPYYSHSRDMVTQQSKDFSSIMCNDTNYRPTPLGSYSVSYSGNNAIRFGHKVKKLTGQNPAVADFLWIPASFAGFRAPLRCITNIFENQTAIV